MGRKKQRPRRAVALQGCSFEGELIVPAEPGKDVSLVETDNPFYVEVDKSSWRFSGDHFDVSEIILSNLEINSEFNELREEDFYQDSRHCLRFRLNNVKDFVSRIKLGESSASSIQLQLVERDLSEGRVMLSGNLDGPDEAVSGLVHLASLKFMTLRPLVLSEDLQSLRLRVEFLRTAFDACGSLVDETRKHWKKSMMSTMAWLRPEVLTSEARYRYNGDHEYDHPSGRCRFDAGGVYRAIQPSKEEPMLDVHLPHLLPELRPYQRRAAYWMIQREKGGFVSELVNPLCVPLDFIQGSSTMYYNPYCGNVSLHPQPVSCYVSGGILADEMGLGKTVELLACIFAHQMSSSEPEAVTFEHKSSSLKRLKRERIECSCGAVTDSIWFQGLWVQCDVCDAWQHASCVGYSDPAREPDSDKTSQVVVTEGVHICSVCSELIQATESPLPTGATLIVCPAPILSQWHAEITRHTAPGSLRVCVYDGVKSSLCSSDVDINQLINADIVLTTYDVLKQDLSQDTDRHEGDRRSLRFEKRYAVVPTLLTRILWWRICLDEAQMVESNAAAAAEMALRLHAKHRWCITGTPIQRKLDDLCGLLKFLRATPFDVSRWWGEVIRRPYEAGDAGAIRFTHDFLKKIMWRSSKELVSDELEIPAQEEHVSWLTLSPIEQHFYQRQYDTCLRDAQEVVKNFKRNAADEFITHLEAAKLFDSLLKLRQACCHPQVGSSGIRSLQQSPMSMQEVLSALIGKTKVEGEEELRKLVSALNGLAGIALLKQDASQAVSLYREALAVAKENSDDFRLDPLLNIHIHHNLADTALVSPDDFRGPEHDSRPLKRARIADTATSSECHSEVSIEKLCNSVLTQQPFREKCDGLKKQYLSAFYSKWSLAQQEFNKSYQHICAELRSTTTWWLEALHYIEQRNDLSSDLIRKIGETLSVTLNTSQYMSCFGSITTLKYYIQTGLDSLGDSRNSLHSRLLEIDCSMEHPSESDIRRVRQCPNCQTDGDGLLCVHCELDEVFQTYEARLFKSLGKNGQVIGTEEAVDVQRKRRFYRANKSASDGGKKRDVIEKVTVSRSPSDLEVVLGIIKNNSKGLLDTEGRSAATKHLLVLEGMRKEYGHARCLALAQAQVLGAHDEVKMAISRLRLREGDGDGGIDALSSEELDAASSQMSGDKFVAVSSLSRIRGQVRYLKGLVVQSEATSSAACICCPVCQERVEGQRMVFPCGHIVCCKCLIAMTEGRFGHHGKKWVMCPTCRLHSDHASIALADDRPWSADPGTRIAVQGSYSTEIEAGTRIAVQGSYSTEIEAGTRIAVQGSYSTEIEAGTRISVQGSYSTKIEAVTRRILSIKANHPKAKVLVFSSWKDVVDVLEHSFVANEISYARMKGGRKCNVAISHFKGTCCYDPVSNGIIATKKKKKRDFVQVLLLQTQHGANGLNLLEAQHVILVEPFLNPAAEAQAVGRVHRIGQHKNTLVHRFIVKDTVEEHIYKLNKSRSTTSFICGNKKNHDEPVLTLNDVQSLFRVAPSPDTHLPPSVAAAMAAESRLLESKGLK